MPKYASQASAQEGTRKENAREESELLAVFIARTRWLLIFFSFFVALVVARLFVAEILKFGKEPQRVVAQTEDNSRGRIVDRNGLLLATDTFIWNIYASPGPYRQHPEYYGPEKLARYAETMGVPLETLTAALAQPGNFTYVAKNVTQAQCETARDEKTLPHWLACEAQRTRSYPQRTLAAHIIGSVNEQDGWVGVEAFYDEWLRLSGNWAVEQLPPAAFALPQDWQGVLPSPGGRDLVLHLSAPLQYLAEQRLAQALTKYQASAGTILVLDPKTGGILALANWPTYDPNNVRGATTNEIINPAVGAMYEPGSVFKLVTYAAALDSGHATPDSQFEDKGKLDVAGGIIRNSQNRRLGWVTMRDALAESLNTVSAEVCMGMGADVFYRYIRQCGFGLPTEVDLDSEAAGIVNRPGSRFYSPYDQAATSYGQGITVTPLQMANVVAAIANHGTLLQPQAAQAFVYEEEVHPLPVRILGQAMKPETAATLSRMMVYTVDNYVDGPKLVPGYRVAGKTGTAEIPEQQGYTSPLTITSFVGFLPAAEPQLVILVKLVEPHTSRWAEQVALPVFGQIARDAVQVMKIAPNNEAP
jgi:cell division protein FtsI (penicillin-binding protein 3)